MILEKLLQAIEKANTLDEITQAKNDYGYTDLLKKVGAIAKKRSDLIIAELDKKRKQRNLLERKKLLKKYIKKNIYYIGSPYKNLYRNRPCKLLKINRTKCLVEFSRKDGQWNIPLNELHPEKTNAKQMVLTEKGIRLI